jgi:hypothetical protein
MKSLLILGGLAASLSIQPASASPEYLRAIPNGTANRCATCHEKSGPPDLNAFGTAFFDANCKWSKALAEKDADGDGSSNGCELGDPEGTWQPGNAVLVSYTTVSLPGDPTSRPVALSRWAVALAPFTTLLGHFHPVFVHLPIGGLVLVGFLELLALFPFFSKVTRNSRLLLLMTLVGTLPALVCGLVLARSGHYEDELLRWHKWTGLAVGGACLGALLLNWLHRQKAYQFSLWTAILLLFIASHYGGSLTHGRDFLTLKLPSKSAPALEAKTTSSLQAHYAIPADKPEFDREPEL